MKLAVLIAGEFREFAIAHKFWSFLKWPGIDCYFSTWSESVVRPIGSKGEIGTYRESVTADQIKSYIKVVDSDIADKESHKEINTAGWMINRWKAAINLMVKSKVQYDRVILLRPDIALDYDEETFKTFILESSADPNDLYGINSGPLNERFPLEANGKMSDLMMFGSLSSLTKLLDLPQCELQSNPADIHSFLAKHCNQIFTRYMNIPIPRQCIVRNNCRGLDELSFTQCNLKSKDWWECTNKVFYSMDENNWGQIPTKTRVINQHKSASINLWDKYDLNIWSECSHSIAWNAPDSEYVFIKNKSISTSEITYGENDITYNYNSYGFRVKNIGPTEIEDMTEYPTLLVGGCSVTEGIGLPENHIWHSFLVENMIHDAKKPIAKYNVGKGGKSIDAVTRYVYTTIEHNKLQPDLVYLLLPPVMRQEVILLDDNDQWFLWDYMPSVEPNMYSSSSIKTTYDSLTRSTNYRQMYHDCFTNLLLLKWFLNSKNIPWFFSFWSDEFSKKLIKDFIAPASSDDCDIPSELLPNYIPAKITQDKYLSAKVFNQTIARDYMHYGPNSHHDLAKNIYSQLREKQEYKIVTEKWNNDAK